MLAKLKQTFARWKQRAPKSEVAALEAELAKGWTYPLYEKLRRLAEAGEPVAQFRLGVMFERAHGVIQNLGDAVHWYRLAAEQGHHQSQTRLGLIYFIDPPAPASLTSDELTRLSAGELRPGTMLGSMFPNGFAVFKDYAEAAKWNRLAAEAGVAESQARYAHQLALGLGEDRNEPEAERWFAAAAKKGDPSGVLGLGVFYAGGYGNTPDYPRAVEWLQKSAGNGDATGHYWLGLLLLQGLGVEKDPEEGASHLRAAVAQDHLEAIYALSMALWHGEGIPQDTSGAETLLRRAASRGHIESSFALGMFLLRGEEDQAVDAANWLRHAAEADHKRAAAALGTLYLGGTGIPRNPTEAAQWLELGEMEAQPDAFVYLAALYTEGRGIAQDYENAFVWLQRAAGRGSAAAQYNLGSFYRYGFGVEQDLAEAVRWYLLAAEQGNIEAAFYLGLLYADAESEIHDDAKAYLWFTRAAEAGHALARYNLAFLLLEGRGVEADPLRGLDLLEAEAADGSVMAAEALFNLYTDDVHLPSMPEQAGKYLALAFKLGSPRAASLLAERLEQGEEVHLDSEHFTSLDQAASDGDIESQVTLARLLAAGAEGSPNLPAAHKWFAEAAQAGDPFAQAWMGDCCRLGLLGPPDTESAELWYRRAAAQNHTGALLLLADALSSSQPDDPEGQAEIFGLWLAAAAAGNAFAQRSVALCYLSGYGCTIDASAGVRWLQLAAEQEDPVAEYELSECCRKGRGTAKNMDQAEFWMARAAEHGYDNAVLPTP